PVPVLIELRQYAQHRGDQGLLAYAGRVLGGESSPVSAESMLEALKSGRVQLLCDALDEIFDHDLRKATADSLREILAGSPDARLIITSRLVGYPDDILGSSGFHHWLIQDFTYAQITRFVELWLDHAVSDIRDQEIVRERMKGALEIQRVREMAGNPL